MKISINKGEWAHRSFESFLFNDPRVFHQQQCSDYSVVNLTDDKENCLARCAIFFKDNQAYSPFRAPFGSIEFSNELTLQQLQYFIAELENFLQAKQIVKFKLVNYPECYTAERASLLTYCLLKQGYNTTLAELNYHINVTTEIDLISGFHDSEKRRYKKCVEQGFVASVETEKDITEAFELIKKARVDKGFPLSMKLEEFAKLFKEFPKDYFLFSVRDKDKLVAVATGVRISSNVLYYFLPADAAEYKNYSPTVLLIKGMYDFCLQHNIPILDLGIASANAVPNYGLINFKQHLGGIPSLKYTFEKTLG